jgi:hypothetical protein
VAVALAVAAGVLGVLAHSGPLVPLLACLVIASGLAQGQVACATGFIAVGPLVAIVGSGHWRLQAAGIALAASSLLFWLDSHRHAHDQAGELRVAARVVTAAGMLVVAAAFVVFIRTVQ